MRALRHGFTLPPDLYLMHIVPGYPSSYGYSSIDKSNRSRYNRIVETTQLAVPDAQSLLKATFATLTPGQQEWLLHRRYFESDKDCSLALHGDEGWHKNYKSRNSGFRTCYEILATLGRGDADAALIESLVDANVLKALIEERKILDLPWVNEDGQGGRLSTEKGKAVDHAISRVKGTKNTTEHVYRVEEVYQVLDTEAKEVV